ncbi:type II secretion system protein [Metabacillus malikii]|uniref:Type IV pilus assembly protein PilA n=1 Tax=Metabacillus malikii TaxID=1504265 RepID=A0ABT9ZKN1_9BACI|nr:type II secretion system protein [Metabacillus malikii]MDQ0232817.1 type IV pilus assembly protein PilA [Metabacillus malikii]
MRKLLKNQRGLTLIELLAVIVILGIIAAIAVPAIGNLIENSREKATVSDAVQIIDAAKIARAEKPETVTFNREALKGYLDKVKTDENFQVSYNEGVYSISNHPAVSIVNTTAGATSATEQQLVDFID